MNPAMKSRIERFLSSSDMSGHLAVVDTETTGLDPERDDILEIAVVVMRDGRVLDTKHLYIDPEPNRSIVIPPESSRVHGIDNDRFERMRENWKRHGWNTSEDVAVPMHEAWTTGGLHNALSGNLLVAHNARFDYSFINAAIRKNQLQEIVPRMTAGGNPYLDTLTIAKIMFPRGRVTLDALCSRYGIDLSSRKNFHGALVDTMLLCDVIRHMFRDIQDESGVGDMFSSMNSVASMSSSTFSPQPGKVIHATDEEKHVHDELMKKIRS